MTAHLRTLPHIGAKQWGKEERGEERVRERRERNLGGRMGPLSAPLLVCDFVFVVPATRATSTTRSIVRQFDASRAHNPRRVLENASFSRTFL